jgi:hypothetical protein
LLRWLALAALAITLVWQVCQCRWAVFDLHSDARAPYPYVPTSSDVVRMTDWLRDLSEQEPLIRNEVNGILGRGYWPLPWYLRGVGRFGYWNTRPEGAEDFPLLIMVPGPDTDIETPTDPSHVWVPRGLRHEVPVWLGVRKDIWDKHLGE